MQGRRKLFITGSAKHNPGTIQLNAWVTDNFTTADNLIFSDTIL